MGKRSELGSEQYEAWIRGVALRPRAHDQSGLD